MGTAGDTSSREPWNKGKIVGQKAPFQLKDIWALRVRLQMEGRVRDLALFNLGIDSKLRGCDLVALKVRDGSMSRLSGPASTRGSFDIGSTSWGWTGPTTARTRCDGRRRR